MAKASSKKPVLPKAILDMKFMKKTKERIEKEINNVQDHNSLYSNSITSEMRHASGNFITETSFIFCEDLMEGRLSFKGMNPEIERLMELEGSMNDVTKGEMVKDVSDEILAKKFASFKNKKRSMDSPSSAKIKRSRN